LTDYGLHKSTKYRLPITTRRNWLVGWIQRAKQLQS